MAAAGGEAFSAVTIGLNIVGRRKRQNAVHRVEVLSQLLGVLTQTSQIQGEKDQISFCYRCL